MHIYNNSIKTIHFIDLLWTCYGLAMDLMYYKPVNTYLQLHLCRGRKLMFQELTNQIDDFPGNNNHLIRRSAFELFDRAFIFHNDFLDLRGC